MRFDKHSFRHGADRMRQRDHSRREMRGFGPRFDHDKEGRERPEHPDFRQRGGPDFGRHRGRPGFGPGRHGRGGRAPRGQVRQAVLRLLLEEPMHGYQLMQAIEERSGGRWTVSPGAIYPTISQLEDEGLVTVEAESGRKLVTLTAAGREKAEAGPDPFTPWGEDAPTGANMRDLLEGVAVAARQLGRHGTEPQITAAATLLDETRRRLYLILAGETPQASTAADESANPTEPIA